MTAIALTAAQIAPIFPGHNSEIYDGVAGVTIAAGQAVFINSSGLLALADTDAGSGAEKAIGIALNGGGAGQGISVLKRGHAYGFTVAGLAYGALIYLSATAGGLDTAPSATNPTVVGRVVPMSDNAKTKVAYFDFDSVLVPGPQAPGQVGFFKSTEATGTGSSQDIAHGLGVAPRLVIFYVTDLTAATAGSVAIVEGTHDATNLKVTVTSGKKFIAVAFA